MESSNTKLKLFDGSLMKPLGEVNLRVIHGGGQAQVFKFQVVGGTNKPLLSGDTCLKLGLLKLGSQAKVLTLDAKQAPPPQQHRVSCEIIKTSSKDWDTLVLAVSKWTPQQCQYSTPPDVYL